jgi:hypothetical protein
MKIYIDCEFNEMGGELISMALVSEGGKFFYESLGCANPKPWVAEHVMPLLAHKRPITLAAFQVKLEEFLMQFKSIYLIADWPDDIAYFCKALLKPEPGQRLDAPPIIMEIVRFDAPSQIPHNALEDARGLRNFCVQRDLANI